MGVALVLSAYPVPAGASDTGAASAEGAQRLSAARSDIEFAASLADGIVEQVAPLCRTSECSEAVASLERVAARQRTLLKRADLRPARVEQSRTSLMAELGRVVAAFEADYPEYRDRIERRGELASLSSGELSSRSQVDSSESASPSLAPFSSTPGPDPGCAPGCSVSTCRSRCSNLGQTFALICAAYAAGGCPICAAICLLVLAQQLSKCYSRCDACPNP